MTPAAFAMAKRMLDVKNVPADERAYWREELRDAHFFECTKIMPLCLVLHDAIKGDPKEHSSLARRYIFLPAPKTWLEFFHKGEKGIVRFAIVLEGDSIREYLLE